MFIVILNHGDDDCLMQLPIGCYATLEIARLAIREYELDGPSRNYICPEGWIIYDASRRDETGVCVVAEEVER